MQVSKPQEMESAAPPAQRINTTATARTRTAVTKMRSPAMATNGEVAEDRQFSRRQRKRKGERGGGEGNGFRRGFIGLWVGKGCGNSQGSVRISQEHGFSSVITSKPLVRLLFESKIVKEFNLRTILN